MSKARDVDSLVLQHTDLGDRAREGAVSIVRGEGCRVWDSGGKDYVDAAAGLACVGLGYSERRLTDAAARQLRRLPFSHTFFGMEHAPAVELAETLLSLAPPGLTKTLFQCSGSEANDAAIKLAWLYWEQRGRLGRRKIIGRTRAYHGNTVATASLSGQPGMHAGFGLPLPGFLHAESPNHYRFHDEGESEEAYGRRIAQSLREVIEAEEPGTIAAFFADPIQGGAGIIPPPPGYFAAVQGVLREHGILFIVDEVTSGFGRTGRMWACETYGLQPDMVTCEKQMSSGYQPISALMISERIHGVMVEASRSHGGFGHGYTYGGHPVACAVALETLRIYAERDIVGHVRAVSPAFLEVLCAFRGHPLVGDVGGVGLAAGVELVRDKRDRLPYPADAEAGRRVQAACMAEGLIVRAVGDSIVFTPPLIVDGELLADIGERFGRALDMAWGELGRFGG